MYKRKHTHEGRCEESRLMLQRYPDRVPIIIEPRDTSTPSIDKTKYMAPRDLMFGQLFYVVRRRLSMASGQGLFFFLNDRTLVNSSQTIADVYERKRDDDGFLYVTYSLENTFG